jgi:hypothetical protein
MPDSGTNIRFQVLVNGAVRGTAGLESVGVLSFILDWVRRDPAAAPRKARKHPDFQEAEWVGNKIRVHLGGLDSAAGEDFEWFRGELQVGDEVTVRVLAPGEFDMPDRRYCVAEGG